MEFWNYVQRPLDRDLTFFFIRQMSASPQFFLAIPSYRDTARLEIFLDALLQALAEFPFSVAVQVVDDGSGATESSALRELVENRRSQNPPTPHNSALLPPLLLPVNRGKGGAIYAGWDHAGTAEWWAFVDADGATSATEVCRLLREVANHPDRADVWLASRIKMLGRSVERTVRRHLMGRVYATLASLLTGLAVYDSQCGCKVFRAQVIQKIRPLLRDMRFGFDMELLAQASREGARMVEFPVDWRDIPGSKVHLLRDSWRMFASLWRLHLELKKRGSGK